MLHNMKNIIRKSLKTTKESIKSTKYVYSEEKINKEKRSIKHKLNSNLKGFSSEKPTLYQFDTNDSTRYLNDYQRYKTKFINGEYSILLGNKIITTKYLQNFDAMPKIYGFIDKNITIDQRKQTLDEFISFLKNKKSLMIKKIKGGGGKGVYRLDYKDEEYKLDSKTVSLEDIEELIAKLDRYYISEVLKQAPYSSTIFPNTVNTIRVLMMRDPQTKEFFIATAVHKFGSSTTGSADNVWRGGLTSQVNLETGILSKPALHQNNNREIKWVEEHPDTLEKIEGVQVPNWDRVKSQLIQMSNEFVMLDYIGWDAVVTADGVRLIEGNNYSEVSILQIHEPLLADRRVRKFYRHHKIIK